MTKFVFIKYMESDLDTMAHTATMPADSKIGLTDKGKADARLVGEALAKDFRGSFSVWSGPSRRCTEPAKIIAELLGVKSQPESRLDERRLSKGKGKLTVAEFRQRQERGYIDPSRLGANELETPFSHRLRVESWLAEILGDAAPDKIHVVVSHGAVVEHLHSAMSWKPVGAMEASFTFCAPGNGHLWGDVVLPDMRRIWGCLGANIDFADKAGLDKPLRGVDDLDGLAVDLASDPRFHKLVDDVSKQKPKKGGSDYYIR